MSKPTNVDMLKLKRLCRYLAGASRAVQFEGAVVSDTTIAASCRPAREVPFQRKARRVHQWQWLPRAASFVFQICAATCRKTNFGGSALHFTDEPAFWMRSMPLTKWPERPGLTHRTSLSCSAAIVGGTASRRLANSPKPAVRPGQVGLPPSFLGSERASTRSIVHRF
jgi:hypothetical protein